MVHQTTLSPQYTYYLLDGDTYITLTGGDMADLEDYLGNANQELYVGEKEHVYQNTSHAQSANFGTFITVCNILTNLVLILLILFDQATRVQFVFQQVLNLALSDLAYSVIVDPFTVYMELQGWYLAAEFCVAWMVLDTALPFVSILILMELNSDRLLFAISPSTYQRTFHHVGVRVLALLGPWLLGLIIILPLWLLPAEVWPWHYWPGWCVYGINRQAAVASAVVSLFLPCVAVIILTVPMLVTIIGGMPQDIREAIPLRSPPPPPPPSTCSGTAPLHSRQVAPPSSFRIEPLGQEEDHGASGSGSGVPFGRDKVLVKRCHRALVVALCVINLVTVITQLPYGAISMLEPNCIDNCDPIVKLLQAFAWMRSSTFTLRPLCLLLITHLRRTYCTRRGVRGLYTGTPRAGTSANGLVNSEKVEVTSLTTSVVSPVKGATAML